MTDPANPSDPASLGDASPGRAREPKLRAWPTLGGLQFWGDVYFFRNWRIQRHALRDDYRLLGPANLRWASGDEAKCRRTLDRVIAERKLEPYRGPAVVLLHGLVRTRHSMGRLAERLRRDGYSVYNVSYPSTRRPVAWQAAHLRAIIEGLTDHDEINLVGYSLGGLIIRAALQGWSDARLRRIVTIGTPHKGAEKADKWVGWPLFEFVAGEVGFQLGTGERGIARILPPTLDVEFGVIAGGRGGDRGYSPILPGDNDWSVTVASTRLPGAADFLLVRTPHSFLTVHRDVLEATSRFLKHGFFRSEAERERIPLEDASAAASETESEPHAGER